MGVDGRRYNPVRVLIKIPGQGWTVPPTRCPKNARIVGSGAYCYIEPYISNVGFSTGDATAGNVWLNRSGAVKLSFNIYVDQDQLPLNSYAVDWGDETVSAVSGVAVRDRVSKDYPFELYHYYNYGDLVEKDKNSNFIFCGNGDRDYVTAGYLPFDINNNGPVDSLVPSGYCIVKVNISVRDNWRIYKRTNDPNRPEDKTIQNTYGWVVVKR